jgi:hypothetical protein
MTADSGMRMIYMHYFSKESLRLELGGLPKARVCTGAMFIQPSEVLW